MKTAQELKDLIYLSCVGEGQRGPTNANGAIDDVYAELARVTQELEAQKQGYKNLMVLNHEYTDETALERQQLKKELAEALAATADWRERMVKAEVELALREADAELEKVSLERDQACIKRDQAMELLKAAGAYNDTYSLNLAETRAELGASKDKLERVRAAVLKIAEQVATEGCVGGWDWVAAELRKAVEGEAL